MNETKVFCCNCKHYRFDRFLIRHLCRHPKNYKDTAIRPKERFSRYADEINNHNRCAWYMGKR